uniref:Uncharacterized protein n=1 Tax=Siphoviridae sp. ctZHD14 TaxID=2827891 RepID=A0A8S5SWJ4_9CAUD|nr:MAG TPA: hypothetical protein [Siphoviridae sp. ctZHD14]
MFNIAFIPRGMRKLKKKDSARLSATMIFARLSEKTGGRLRCGTLKRLLKSLEKRSRSYDQVLVLR